jgi:serine/threonine protein kinase
MIVGSNEALLKRRAALQAIIQDCATAGMPTPESTQLELQDVLDEIDKLGLDVDNASAVTAASTWTDYLGKMLDGFQIKRMLSEDSYSFSMRGFDEPAETGKADASAGTKVFKIAKDELPAASQELMRLNHGTQCLRIVPFDTAPITVAINDLIGVQFERLADVKDSGVIPVEDFCDDGSNHYYRMPFVPGRLLKHLMKDKSITEQTRIEEALYAVSSVAKTMHRLRSAQPDFYHGDLKPENILLRPDTGTVLLNPGYFGSISAVEGDYEKGMVSTIAYYPFLEPDDLLALGICLYEAVTGVHPFNQRMIIPSADESFEPTRLSAELCDAINFRRSLLEPYATPLYLLQPPRAISEEISMAVEILVLKALRARVDRNGTIHSDPGFKDFREMSATVKSILESEFEARAARKRRLREQETAGGLS